MENKLGDLLAKKCMEKTCQRTTALSISSFGQFLQTLNAKHERFNNIIEDGRLTWINPLLLDV